MYGIHYQRSVYMLVVLIIMFKNRIDKYLVKGALYRIQILCRRYTFWSYPVGLTIADPPG